MPLEDFFGSRGNTFNSSLTLLMVNSLAIAAVSKSDDVRKVTVND